MLQKHKSYFFGLQTYRQHNVLNIIWFSVRTENSKKSSNSTRILVLILVSVLYPIGFSRNLQIPLGYQYLLYSFLFGKNPWAPPLSFPIVQNCWSGYQNGIKWTSWSSVQIQDSFLCQSCPTCRARDRELKRTKVGLRNMSIDNKKYKQNEIWLLPDCLHLVLDHTVRLWGSLAWAPLFDLVSTQRIMRRRCLWWAATSRTISFSGHVELPTWTTFSSSIPLVAKRAAINLAQYI